MIKEAYRVLKPGSVAAFTVWGRREESLRWTWKAEAKKRLGVEEVPDNERSNFDMARDIDTKWTTVFQEAGFAQTKRWYQPTHCSFRNGADFLDGPIGPSRENLEPDMQQAVIDSYDELSGANTPDLKVMEVMVIVAYKD